MKRDKIIMIRVTESEKEKIEKLAAKQHMPVAVLVRQLALKVAENE